jgi:hypothetical protein
MWGIAQQIYRSERPSCATEPVRTGPAAEVEIAGDAPPSAAISARIARCEKLKPEDDKLESFIAWVAKHGGPLDDPDELLAQYAWMCRAAGWDKAPEPDPLPIPEPAPVAQTPPPPAKRGKKQKAPKATPADKAPTAREIAPSPAKTTLAASVAAERFVEWVRLSRREGTYSSNELTDLYREHCKAEDLIVLHENVLRPAMLKLDGVIKHQLDTGGKHRHRPFRWTIAKAATVVDDIPWQELPIRRVA